MIKQCKWCGKEYETDLYWWNFCCEECHDAFKDYIDHRLINCAICGRPFHPIRGNQKYCSPKCYKEGQKINDRRKYLKNRDKYLERSRQWAKEHKEEHNKQGRKFYHNHRDEILAKKKLYKLKNKEKINAYQRQYYLEHKEEYKIRKCKRKHNDCYDCDMPVGVCRYD